MDHFTDYETVFSNFSVPVSCCNTTNPLASECPDIVRNSQQMINKTGLIYSEVSACSVRSILSLTHYLVVCLIWSHSSTTCSLLLLQSLFDLFFSLVCCSSNLSMVLDCCRVTLINRLTACTAMITCDLLFIIICFSIVLVNTSS